MSQAGSLGSGGSGTTSPLTTKGDIYGYDTDNARIPVGADGLVLKADSGDALGVSWGAVAGTGDVVGPAGATDNAVARYNGATGVLIQDSGIIVDDSDNITGVVGLTLTGNIIVSGTVDGRDIATDGTKLDGIEALADVTDTTNVNSALATSVGTVTTGVWQGTIIADEYGGTGQSSFTKGDILYASAANVLSKLAIGTDTHVLTVSTDVPAWSAAAGGTPPPKEYWFAAESLQPLETNFGPLEKLSGTTVKTFVRAFDDTTEEFSNGKLQVPGDVSTTGADTVTFRAYVMAKTAVASKNVKLTFGHVAVNDSEDFDVAYTDVSIDDQAIDATQDDVTEITWTASLTTLAWSANDLVFFRFSRESATTTNLAGDMYLFSLAIEIPRE